MAEAYETVLFGNRLEGISEEMGRLLARSAFSPNIRERLDFSCALFTARGELLAQAAHIPVHLGSLPDLIQIIQQQPQSPGDGWIANSPYHGGTHLPDLTMVAPIFGQPERKLLGFVAARAHHSDVGGMTPGSMPNSREVYQEGLILPPTLLMRRGRPNKDLWQILLANVRTPVEREGDLRAQWAACQLGVARCQEYFAQVPLDLRVEQLLAHGERQMQALLQPLGQSPPIRVEEELDWGDTTLTLRLELKMLDGFVELDFRSSCDAQPAPINATRAITCAAAYFPFFCLAQKHHGRVVVNQGSLRRIQVKTRPGSLLEACSPYPVCAGNVETSQRVCDLVWKALAPLFPELVAAQSASTMNNLTLGNSAGSRPFSYYETCGGGHGGGPLGPGASGQQVAMTNTRNTPAEILETYYPVRLWRYQLQPGSGGAGQQPGGQGVVRELELLAPAQLSLLASRRRIAPQGLMGGKEGLCAQDQLQNPDGSQLVISPPWSAWLESGSRFQLTTPGGGGWGQTS